MHFYRIRKAYKALDSAQKAFLKEKRIEETLTIREWQRFLKKIASYDKINDNLRDKAVKQLAIVTTLAVLLTIIAITLVLFLPSQEILVIVSVLFFVCFWLGGLLFTLFKSMYKNRYVKNDIVNHLRKFILPLLLILKEDAHPKTSVQLMLDFNKGTRPEKMIEEEDSDDKSPYLKYHKKVYQHQWSQGAIRLNDQTSIRWEGFDEIQQVRTKKQGLSGRIKNKQKYKVKHWVSMRIAFQKAMYQLKNKEAVEEITTETADNYIFKLKIKQKYQVGRYPDGQENAVDPNLFLAAIAQAYQQMEPLGDTQNTNLI